MRNIPAPKGRGDRPTFTALTDPLSEGWLAGLGLSAGEITELLTLHKNVAAEAKAFQRRSSGLFSTSFPLSKGEADRRLKLAMAEKVGGDAR